MDEEELTTEEAAAIRSLQRLAKKWPKNLRLISMAGSLFVVRAGDGRFHSDSTYERSESVIADIHGIPNTGGDW